MYQSHTFCSVIRDEGVEVRGKRIVVNDVNDDDVVVVVVVYVGPDV